MSIVSVHGPNTWGDDGEVEPEQRQRQSTESTESTEDEGPTIYDADAGEDVPGDVEELGFDPADYTVAEIEDFIKDNPDEAPAVLAQEKAGKNRTTLVGYLEGVVAGE